MKLDAKYMATVLTQDGFMKWCEDKPLTVVDIKPEFRGALASNFIVRRA